MNIFARRRLLAGFSLLVVGATIAGCGVVTTTTTGSVKTATVNTADVKKYGDLLLGLGSVVLADPSITADLGAAQTATLQAQLLAIRSKFDVAMVSANGLTLTLDGSSVSSDVASVLSDVQSLLKPVAALTTNAKAQGYINQANLLIATLQLAAGIALPPTTPSNT